MQMQVKSHRLGLNRVSEEEGKPSLTVFRRLSYNGHTSLVECHPRTGRTHQIRVRPISDCFLPWLLPSWL